MKKHLILFVILGSLIGLGIVGARAARAGLDAPPSEMSQLEAAQLDADIAHIARIQQRAQIESAPHMERVAQVCKKYKIDPQDLGKTVGVDFKTGKIQRQEVKQP